MCWSHCHCSHAAHRNSTKITIRKPSFVCKTINMCSSHNDYTQTVHQYLLQVTIRVHVLTPTRQLTTLRSRMHQQCSFLQKLSRPTHTQHLLEMSAPRFKSISMRWYVRLQLKRKQKELCVKYCCQHANPFSTILYYSTQNICSTQNEYSTQNKSTRESLSLK